MRLTFLRNFDILVPNTNSTKKLFINTVIQSCGVYQYGLRLFNILNVNNDFDYIESITPESFSQIPFDKYHVCIYNFHPQISPWFDNIHFFNQIPNLMYIVHDTYVKCTNEQSRAIDTTPINPQGIPRPLFISPNSKDRITGGLPVIGSFGYASPRKKFDKIIELVHRDFPDGAHIRIQTTKAFYDPSTPDEIYAKCNSLMVNPKITLDFITETYSDQQIFDFLQSNDLNVFLYDSSPVCGCSSVLDFAIPAGRPIAISDSNIFRHIYSDSICAYKRSLKDIINDGTEYIRQFQDKWSAKNLTNTFNKLIY